MVLKKAIVVQIKGNAFGGGCHDGFLLSLKTGSSLLADGRELSSGENMRLLTDMKKKNAHMTAVCNFAGRASLTKAFSMMFRYPTMRDH